MSEPPSEIAATLIAALEVGGELVDEGRFRLDLAQAREKLRAYLLADPDIYGCLLVEVSVLVGAERIEFSTSGDELQVDFGGAGFVRGELEFLPEAIFVELRGVDEREQRRRRGLQLLSLMLQAVLGLGAERLDLHSQPAGGRLTVCVENGQESWRFEPLEPPRPAGTQLRLCFARGLLATAKLPGIASLRTRCRWSEHPIYLDGDRISAGHRAAFVDGLGRSCASVDPVPVLDEHSHAIGQATVLRATLASAGQLRLLVNGWLVESLRLPNAMVGFEAVVEVDLRRDLAQAQVLRTPEFDALLLSVERAHALLGDQAQPGRLVHIERKQGPPIAFMFFWYGVGGVFCVAAFGSDRIGLGIVGVLFTGIPVFVKLADRWGRQRLPDRRGIDNQ